MPNYPLLYHIETCPSEQEHLPLDNEVIKIRALLLLSLDLTNDRAQVFLVLISSASVSYCTV